MSDTGTDSFSYVAGTLPFVSTLSVAVSPSKSPFIDSFERVAERGVPSYAFSNATESFIVKAFLSTLIVAVIAPFSPMIL